MTAVASFHLVRLPPGPSSALSALAHLGLDRRALAATPGLHLWRLLGTGRGRSTGVGIDAHRTALFAVWDDELDLEVFLAGSSVARRWRAAAAEVWSVRLRSLGGTGSWRGVDVPGHLAAGGGAVDRAAWSGPVAVLTRADVRSSRWRRFHAAGPAVSAEVAAAGGLLAVVGIGEAPIGAQATFSLWESAGAVTAFAYSSPHHVDVVRRTRSEGWYGEELFARFAPFASTGTWDGIDPLTVVPK